MARIILPEPPRMLVRRKGKKQWKAGHPDQVPTKWHIPSQTEGYTVCGSLYMSPRSRLETATLDKINAVDICKRCLGFAVATDSEEGKLV